MKPVAGSAAPSEPPQRFEVEAVRAPAPGWEMAQAVVVAMVAAGFLWCPFIWAFGMFLYIRRTDRRAGTALGLQNAPAGAVEAHEDHVVFSDLAGGATRVERRHIENGWIEESDDGFNVVVQAWPKRKILLRLASQGEAEALLTALGVSPAQQTTRFALSSPSVKDGQGWIYHLLGPWLAVVAGLPMLTLGGVAATLAGAGGVALAVAALGFAFLIIRRSFAYIRRGAAVVGRDGVTIREKGKERFLSFANLRGVSLGTHAHTRRATVEVSTESDTFELLCGTFAADDPGTVEALRRRIERAWHAYQGDDADDRGLHLLERRGRSAADWREALAALVQEKADYRGARLNPVHLVEAAEDATLPVERRLGAAVALSTRDADIEVKRRLRVAADVCAHPQLRVVLDQTADGELEEEALEEALTALPPSSRQPRLEKA